LILDQVAYGSTIGYPRGFAADNREMVLQNWSYIMSSKKNEGEGRYFNDENIRGVTGRVSELKNESPSSSDENTIWDVCAAAHRDSLKRLFFQSPKGYIGLVEDGVRYTDYICFLLGLNMPSVL
jgi:hypothetical protein